MKKSVKGFILPCVTIISLLASLIFPAADLCAAENGKFAVKNDAVNISGTWVHHFSDEAVCGCSQFSNDSMDYEALAGFRAVTNGTSVSFTPYMHNKAYSHGKASVSYPDAYPSDPVELGEVDVNKTYSFDIKAVADKLGTQEGIYELSLETGKDYRHIIRMHLYYDGSSVRCCRVNGNSASDIDAWNKLTGKLDPSKCLDMYVGSKNYPITYPTSGTNGACNHVQEWCDLSDEIVLADDWPDELKVFSLVLWLSKNCAYDDWRVKTNNNKSRATLANSWDDDNLWMYYNHVGQCWDFANAMTIMCRHQGIPCTTVEDTGHTLNAVWLHNEWTAIDVSVLVEHTCTTDDTDPAGWSRNYAAQYNEYYGYYNPRMITYNQCIATPETTLSGRSGKNPM